MNLLLNLLSPLIAKVLEDIINDLIKQFSTSKVIAAQPAVILTPIQPVTQPPSVITPTWSQQDEDNFQRIEEGK